MHELTDLSQRLLAEAGQTGIVDDRRMAEVVSTLEYGITEFKSDMPEPIERRSELLKELLDLAAALFHYCQNHTFNVVQSQRLHHAILKVSHTLLVQAEKDEVAGFFDRVEQIARISRKLESVNALTIIRTNKARISDIAGEEVDEVKAIEKLISAQKERVSKVFAENPPPSKRRITAGHVITAVGVAIIGGSFPLTVLRPRFGVPLMGFGAFLVFFVAVWVKGKAPEEEKVHSVIREAARKITSLEGYLLHFDDPDFYAFKKEIKKAHTLVADPSSCEDFHRLFDITQKRKELMASFSDGTIPDEKTWKILEELDRQYEQLSIRLGII